MATNNHRIIKSFIYERFQEKWRKFCVITLGGEPELMRYNSRLPLVIYVPQGVEVRYRIWRGDDKVITAPKG